MLAGGLEVLEGVLELTPAAMAVAVAAAAAVAVAGVTVSLVVEAAADGDVGLSAGYVAVVAFVQRTRWGKADDLPWHDAMLGSCFGLTFVSDRPAAEVDGLDTGQELRPGPLVVVSAAAAAVQEEGEVSWS